MRTGTRKGAKIGMSSVAWFMLVDVYRSGVGVGGGEVRDWQMQALWGYVRLDKDAWLRVLAFRLETVHGSRTTGNFATYADVTGSNSFCCVVVKPYQLCAHHG